MSRWFVIAIIIWQAIFGITCFFMGVEYEARKFLAWVKRRD